MFTGRQERNYTGQSQMKSNNGREKSNFTCQVCKVQPGHLLNNCPVFKEKTPSERHKIIKELNRCFCCFSAHRASECKNPKTCSECAGRHHTMLHLSTSEETVTAAHVTLAASETKGFRTSVLLATASVIIFNVQGIPVTVRALLDCASQSSFITERCVHLLGIRREKRDITVQGLSGLQVPVVKGSVNIDICPVGLSEPKLNIDALILNRITGPLPSERVWNDNWSHLNYLTLADPDYAKSLPVDILLGADVFPQLLTGQKKEGKDGGPIALSTVFGWVLMGKTSTTNDRKIVTMCSTLESVNDTLQKFLEVEDVPTIEKCNPEDQECEQIYKSTTTCQADGRYVVHLPFIKYPPLLGESKEQALRRLCNLESRFSKNPEWRESYNKEMQNYLDNNHMAKLEQSSVSNKTAYYIPHHAVIRPESTTTKMRIVFDASAKTSSGMSLNDNLHCAKDEAGDDEIIKTIVHHDIYVDDLVTGANSVEEAIELQQKLVTLFKRGQFELRKWSSNSKELLAHIPLEHQQTHPVTFNEHESEIIHVLGLNWDPKVDVLSYKYRPNAVKFSLSEPKLNIDALILNRYSTDLKRLMKYLCLIKVDWDEPIPEEAAIAWTQYHQELPMLTSLQIPRIVIHPNAKYELHGFSDSSEAAYAAAVYLRIDTGTEVICYLLMGKSKIAPAKKLSIPRLELCGAWLLARLLTFVQRNLTSINVMKSTAWTDSTVVLSWIRSSTDTIKTFVANRVAKIHQLTPIDIWRHVPTTDNPADCASRGLGPKGLVSHNLWWTGPSFLHQDSSEWLEESVFSFNSDPEVMIEEKPISLFSQVQETDLRLLYQSENLPKILRLTAYWLRVKNRLRKKPILSVTTLPTTVETDEALRALVRWTQYAFFPDAIKSLSMGKPAPVSLRKLTPFLDEDQLLRVGGRLNYSSIPYHEKHPLLLPKMARLTELLINHIHRTNGHSGQQTAQNLLRQNYWILSSRSVIKRKLHQCIPCFRAKPRPSQPIMVQCGDVVHFIPGCPNVLQAKPNCQKPVAYLGRISAVLSGNTAINSRWVPEDVHRIL
ncbi:uncharacterized protein LOC126893679 [Daktulosphaira vitifoliae]|uniref:uncharacterized protein LOC126893679 n=1 Tax=Daktulosphaira vitifoliae TaxID=58002 RepID=UPI0021A98B56|nr:uncharacterized protein LOC126893679 [Daktulosphaira vitifoliae]